jgi:hypothetical protein
MAISIILIVILMLNITLLVMFKKVIDQQDDIDHRNE